MKTAVRVVHNRRKDLPYSVYLDEGAGAANLRLLAGFTAGGDAHHYAATVAARLRGQGRAVELFAAP